MSAVVRCDGCYQDIEGVRWRLGINLTDQPQNHWATVVFGEATATQAKPEYRDFHGLACVELWVRMAMTEGQTT